MKAFKTIYTAFYSYKGGVGRTSALVNAAILRAIAGDRVVIIDFDFEAPGISAYIKEFARKNNCEIDLDKRAGLLEYLHESIYTDTVPELKNISVTNEDLGLDIEGRIHIIGAGDTTQSDYVQKFTSMNWHDIFEMHQGELLLSNFKKQIAKEFNSPDYVFIDSRTGISEVGGVCTRYLADSVVVLSSLNEQNIAGTSRVYDTFSTSELHTILVASNVPVGLPWDKNQLFFERIEQFESHFGKQPDLLIYHYPSLALMEYIPAYFKLRDSKNILKDDPLLKSYEVLSEKINDDNNHSFDVFLEGVVNHLFADKRVSEGKIEDDFIFFRKHYANRINTLIVLELVNIVRTFIHKNDAAAIVCSDSIEAMISLNEEKSKIKNENLDMLVHVTFNVASSQIVSYFSDNRDKIGSDVKWFDVLDEHLKLDAVEILIKEKLYDLLWEKLQEFEGDFYSVAKGFIADKLGYKEDSIKYFEKFLDDMIEVDSEIDSSGLAFAISYSYYMTNDYSKSKDYIDRAFSITERVVGSNSFPFVPTEFRRENDKALYIKEIMRFKKEIEKHL